MLLAVRWAHKHTTIQSANASALSHAAASFGSKTVRQPPGPIIVTSSPYRALKASVFPKILLKRSQKLQGVLMYHIDYLQAMNVVMNGSSRRRNATLLDPFHSEYDAVEGSSQPW
jgi:hypothetical protein